jgi:4-nitrophenyl phosphatase
MSDAKGRGMTDLGVVRAVILDMDGVLWRGDQVLPQAAAFLDFLRGRGIPFALATNNSGNSPAQYDAKLARMGLGHVPQDRVITSGVVAVHYLKQNLPSGARIYVIGEDGLRGMVAEAGFVLVDGEAEAVLAGIDRNFTYAKAYSATRLIRAGALFVGTNPDLTFPMPEGLSPGAGSILAMLAAAGGRQPVVMGKPERAMFEQASAALGIPLEQTLMIGDRLDTDIAGAVKLGLQTVLVLTGIETRESAAAHPGIDRTLVVDNLAALQAQWPENGENLE